MPIREDDTATGTISFLRYEAASSLNVCAGLLESKKWSVKGTPVMFERECRELGRSDRRIVASERVVCTHSHVVRSCSRCGRKHVNPFARSSRGSFLA